MAPARLPTTRAFLFSYSASKSKSRKVHGEADVESVVRRVDMSELPKARQDMAGVNVKGSRVYEHPPAWD